MRLLKVLIILLLIVFPFGEILRFDIGNNIRFKPIDIISGLLLVSWIILFVSKRIKITRISLVYLAFPVVCLISLLINSFWLNPHELLAASLYLIRWVSYLSVFFVMLQFDERFLKKVLTLLLLDGVIIVILGFLQFFFFNYLKPWYYMGWDDHMYRLFSVFLDPNYTGAILSLYTFFVGGLLYKIAKVKKPESKQTILALPFSITNRNLRALLVAVISFAAIAMFLTFSRSTIVMFLIGASVFFILIGRKRLILVLLGFILLFIVLISSKFYIENVNLFRQASTSARLNNYQVALTIFKSDPVLGVGFNAFRYAKAKHNIQMEWAKTPSHADAGADNSFLFILATTGVVGLLAYLVLWFSIGKRAFFLHKSEKNIYAVVFLASIIGLFVHAMFINSLFFPAIMVWMWLINGLMERT